MRKYSPAAALAWVLVSLFGTVLVGQDYDDTGRRHLGALKIFEGDSRPFRQLLRKAREAIDEERYEDALSDLGRLLTSDAAKASDDGLALVEDYFLLSRDGETLTSIKSEALRLLASVPAKALKQYELQHGADAEALLEDALAQGNADKLAEVMRRYFHTQAGYRACLALGRLNLEQGRPAAAETYLQRLFDTPAAETIVEPDASVLLAGAQWHAGQPDKAKQTLLSLKQRRPNFVIQAVEPSRFGADDDALPWLTRLFGKPHSGSAATAREWTMFRGNAQRNIATSFAEPTSTPRWRVPIANDPNDEQLIAEAARSYQHQEIAALPSMHPLAVRNVVLMRGPEQLVAIDVASGKRIWVHPFQESAAKQELHGSSQNAASVRTAQLEQRVWDDAPRGQLSSDGEFVFVIDELGDVSQSAGRPRSFSSRDPFDRYADRPQSTNVLCALSLKKQGSLIWQLPVGGEEDPLEGAFFLGAPLPVNGQLYVLAEIKGEIALVALEAATGEFKWKQQVGHVESFNILADPLRRLAGASPSFADGVLVCPTSAGAVVAIDLATRRLVWGTEYARTTEARLSRAEGPYGTTRMAKYGDRWVDATATIADRKVIVTPPDSAELHCFELSTGKPVWPAQRRDEMLFVAGVHQGTIVVVGKSHVVGIKLSDGKQAWEAEIDLPSGRGVLDGSHYYQPTVSGKLHVIDVTNGESKDAFSTAQPLGNLVTYHDDIISLSHESLAAYARVDRLQEKIEEALSRDPRDPWALARQGELLMHQEKWEEAIGVLRLAFSQPTPDPAAQGLLVETMLSLLEHNYTQHAALGSELEKLIDDAALKSRYYRVVASGREKAGDRAGAFQAFMAIASDALPAEAFGSRDKVVPIDLAWQARSDRWVAAHLANLYRAATADQRRAMDAALSVAWNSIPKNAPRALRSFIGRYAFHSLAQQAKLELARLLIASGNLLEAELQVQELTVSSDPQLAARATALSAQILVLAKRWPEALRRYERLGNQFASIEIASGVTGRKVYEEAASQFDYRQASAAASRQFPRGRAVVEADTRTTLRNVSDQRKNYPLTLLQADVGGDAPPVVVLEPQQNLLRVRDSQGHDTTVVHLNRSDDRRFYGGGAGLATARLAGGLLVVSTGHEVFAVDLLRQGRDPADVVLWRQELNDSNERSAYNQPKNVANPWTTTRSLLADSSNRPLGIFSPITAPGLCFVRQKQLVCVDPLTGETQWQRGDVESGSDLFGDDEYLFVSTHNSEVAQAFRMVDGSPAGERAIPAFEHRWASCGRNLLSWSQSGKGMKLQLDDVWAGKNVWTETAPSGSRAWLCSPDEVAIATAEGSLKIRSLRNDAVILEAHLDREKELQQLFVLKSLSQYLVFVSLPPINPLPGVNVQPSPGGSHSPLFTGKIYAFDVATGQRAWSAPAAVSQMSVLLDQPLDQPVLLLLRNVSPRSGVGSQQHFTSMLCIDKRTGAVIFEDSEIANPSATYDLEAELDSLSVRAAVPGKAIRIRFTEDPAPPEPPVQNDQAFIVRPGSGTISGLLRRALQPRVDEPIFDFDDP